MDEVGLKLDKETLELINFERSKMWAKILEQYSNMKNEKVINLYNVEQEYCDANGEADLESSSKKMEEAIEEKEGEDNALKNTWCLTENLKVSNACGILAQINSRANASGIFDPEIQMFLEDTLPVVEEHRREWREAGLDKVLNTFNSEYIEEKVGSYLRRNNSLVNRNLSLSPFNTFESSINKTYSDTDSCDSVDTARYIRSSRKQLSVKNKISKTTTIKSYRLIKFKYAELHRKYDYLTSDNTIDFLNGARHRNQNACCEHALEKRTIDLHKDSEMRSYEKNRRIRKPLHRKYCKYPNTSYSSSDSDERYSHLKPLGYLDGSNHSRPAHRNKYREIPDKIYEEFREPLPYRREDECSCSGAEKLCNNARHLANSSGDDWLVENVESPRTVKRNSKKLLTINKSKHGTSQSESEQELQPQATEKNTLPIIKKEYDENSIDKEKPKKKNTKTIRSSKAKKQVSENIHQEDSFDSELQEAIRLSKQQYEEELKSRVKTNISQANSLIKTELSKNSSKTNKSGEEKDVKILADSDNLKIDGHSNRSNKEEGKNKNLSKKPKTNKVKANKDEIEKTKSSISTEMKSIPTAEDSIERTKSKAKRTTGMKRIPNFEAQIAKNKSSRNSKPEMQFSLASENKIHDDPSFTKNSTKRDLSDETNENKHLISHLNEHQQTNKSNDLNNILKSSGDMKSKQNSKKTKSSSTSPTENIKSTRKSTKTRKRILTSIKELSSEDSDFLEVPEKTIRNKINAIPTSNALAEYTTLFAASEKIYNSTAFGDNTSNSSQFQNNSTQRAKQLNPIKKNKISSVKKDIKKELPYTENTNDIDKKKSVTIEIAENSTECRMTENGLIQESHANFKKPISTENDDCIVTSSTSCNDFQSQTVKESNERILLYTPRNQTLVPENSINKGRVRITEEHLASFIGDEKASKFMKYYQGRLEFKESSTIYYKPPNSDEADSSTSEVEVWELCRKYGELDESKGEIV